MEADDRKVVNDYFSYSRASLDTVCMFLGFFEDLQDGWGDVGFWLSLDAKV